LRCQRLHCAAGRGLCVTGHAGFFSTYDVYTFGADFALSHKMSLSGLPSRTRVSPDGRYGAITVFVAGHSYAAASFSTKTMLLDLTSGAELGDLEQFTVSRNGQPFKSVDFNFWGVTFAPDGDRFYATLRTGGQTYLVEGEVAARRPPHVHIGGQDANRLAPARRPRRHHVSRAELRAGRTRPHLHDHGDESRTGRCQWRRALSAPVERGDVRPQRPGEPAGCAAQLLLPRRIRLVHGRPARSRPTLGRTVGRARAP